ncbi:MAG: LemA family protein [Clostridium sp.]|nr:LemA family protein [Clostridium sp.]
MIYLILGLILLVILLLVINFLYYKNKFNFYFLKVEEADNNIELILEKKIEILLKIAKIIDKDMEKELEEFKKKEISKHQCYIELSSLGNKLLKEADAEEYESNKKLNNLIGRFDDNECDLKGSLKYYNDNAVEINNYIHKFPSNIVSLFSHFKELDIYKIEKRESFAILSK